MFSVRILSILALLDPDPHCQKQCSRSGKFLGFPDPDPLVRGTDPDPSALSNIVRKIFISTVLWLLKDFLSLKNAVNVPSKRNKQKNFDKNSFLLASWRSLTKRAGSESESVVSGTDPRIRIKIRTKISRIRNAGQKGLALSTLNLIPYFPKTFFVPILACFRTNKL